MKKTIITLTLLLCATLSFAQELKVKQFTHDQMSLEARVGGGRKDLNGKQCALIKVQVRDDIVDCTGGNVGEIISKGIVKKVFVSPDTKFLKFEFKYNYPLKVTFADYGIKSLAEGGTYTLTLVDAYALSQQNNTQNVESANQQSQSEQPSEPIVQPEPNPDAIPIEVNGVTFYMIKVDGGTFTMGATPEMEKPRRNEKPAHEVTLSSYCIGETEVTQALWKAVMGTTPRERWNKWWAKVDGVSFQGKEGDNYPMYSVTWNECQDFIRKLNELTNKKFRLPTEAEWEFAARGGNKSNHTQYSGSSNIDEVAWHYGNSVGGDFHIVKTKKANELGIYDMSGNVWEWCQDWKGSYSNEPKTNPTGPEKGSKRVKRGGCSSLLAMYSRSSYREFFSPEYSLGDLGFRLVLSE